MKPRLSWESYKKKSLSPRSITPSITVGQSRRRLDRTAVRGAARVDGSNGRHAPRCSTIAQIQQTHYPQRYGLYGLCGSDTMICCRTRHCVANSVVLSSTNTQCLRSCDIQINNDKKHILYSQCLCIPLTRLSPTVSTRTLQYSSIVQALSTVIDFEYRW